MTFDFDAMFNVYISINDASYVFVILNFEFYMKVGVPFILFITKFSSLLVRVGVISYSTGNTISNNFVPFCSK